MRAAGQVQLQALRTAARRVASFTPPQSAVTKGEALAAVRAHGFSAELLCRPSAGRAARMAAHLQREADERAAKKKKAAAAALAADEVAAAGALQGRPRRRCRR